MRHARHHLDVLAELHHLSDVAGQHSAWRQGMATLAAEAADHRPVPLEGIHPEPLQQSVQVVLAHGWLDSLDWLSPPHAAAALYELASALPVGGTRRDLGRRVLRWVHEGDAATFVALAERLALGTRRGLTGAGIRARVGLALDLPIGSGINVDRLALALISRPDLEREWLGMTSTGSLPSRRLAARLIERAAWEASRRALHPDDAVAQLFTQPSFAAAWERLLQDREPLVWRHVASARGLLSRLVPSFEERIKADLDARLTPTEWRRAAASLAAELAVDAEQTLERCRELIRGKVFERDPGIAGSMILGVSLSAEAEPDAADLLLSDLIRVGGLDAIEALVLLRQERVDPTVGTQACVLARQRIRDDEFGGSSDDGRVALVRALDADLQKTLDGTGTEGLRSQLVGARLAYVREGARAAHACACQVVDEARRLLDLLESLGANTQEARHSSFFALRDLDHALLESSSLSDLLTLGPRSDATVLEPLDRCFERLARWLVRQEAQPIVDSHVAHLTLRIHRLRAMLHLVDADSAVAQERLDRDRERRIRSARLLLDRVSQDTPSRLRRVVAASSARACDALLREEVGELSDVLVLVADRVHEVLDLSAMSEASMAPSMVSALRGFGRLAERFVLERWCGGCSRLR